MEKDKNIDFKLFDTLDEYESQLPAGGWEGLNTRRENKNRKKMIFSIAATMLVLSGFSFLIIPEHSKHADKPGMAAPKDHTISTVPEKQVEPNPGGTLTDRAAIEYKETKDATAEISTPVIIKPELSAYILPTIEPITFRPALSTSYLALGESTVKIVSPNNKKVQALPENFKFKHKIVPGLYMEYSNGAGQLAVSSTDPNRKSVADGNNKLPSIRREQFELGTQFSLNDHWAVGLGAAYSKFRVNSGPYYSYPYRIGNPITSMNNDTGELIQEPLPQHSALSFKPWVRYQAGRRWKVHIEAGLRGEYLFNKKGGIDYVDPNFKIAPGAEKHDNWNWVFETGIGISYPVYKSMRISAGYSLGRSLNTYYKKDDLSIGLNFQELKIRVDIPLSN